jgi:CubicO group peptidase (beta-lactamase class C family)
MNRRQVLLLVGFHFLMACGAQQPLTSQELDEILGSWSGGEVLEQTRPDSQVVYFEERPDGSIVLSMIFELGPRSRVWTYDIDVTYGDGMVSWAYHEGHLNPARDTMWVSKNYRGDRSEWMWVRNRDVDPLVERLLAMEETPFEFNVPPALGDGWESADPGTVGLDRELLDRFLTLLSEGEFGDIHSLLVVRHDTLVVEEYFAEGGSKHGPFIDSVYRDRTHHLASTTKTITSALIGIAIDRGFIGSVHDPIIDYLPGHAHLLQGEKGAITIDHLLTMSPGLDWSQQGPWDSTNDGRALIYTDDVVGYVLQKELVAEPGTRFVYSNGTPAVAGAILENATGMSVGEFAKEYLFGPLGITDYLWTSYSDGTVEADGGLALRPRDLAKIGQTYLDNGRWRGTAVVSEEWVEHSTRGRFVFTSIGGAPVAYGSFWNQMELPTPAGPVTSYCHGGSGGEFLMVIPDLDMVVVFTAGVYGVDPKRMYHAILSDYVLAGIDRPTGS